jgi:predicted dehydrogenase
VAVTVSIFGYGKVARELHRPVWEQLQQAGAARVISIYEPAREGARLARRHFPHAEVVEAPAWEGLVATDSDLVDICTPGHTHAELVLKAASEGHNVLVEKPLCHTTAELRDLIRASGSRKIAVYQTRRYSEPIISFIEARERGAIGRVTRVQMIHHARHILNEAEWVVEARPDGVLFENVVHHVDLAQYILGTNEALNISAARFYETSHQPILTGVEFMAEDDLGRRVSVDFLQDSLTHSSFQSVILISATAADVELRFSPPGLRLMSGLLDPFHDLAADARRMASGVRQVLRPATRAAGHHAVASDMLAAIHHDRTPALAPAEVAGTVGTIERLSRLWTESRKDRRVTSHA